MGSEQKLLITGYGSRPLVGYLTTSYPIDGGNCLISPTSDGGQSHVANLTYENLRELIRRGEIGFPIEARRVSPRAVEVIDARVPADWKTPPCWCSGLRPAR